MVKHFDVGVIGSGPAGLSAAHPLQAAGQATVIIEEYLWGGTCPNYGCDPKKVLIAAVEAKERAEWLKNDGLAGNTWLDWPKLMAHKMAYTDPVPARKIAALDATGVTHVYGHGQFLDAHTVEVNGERITADTWIIATGARPARLNVPGDEYLADNEAFLNLPAMPAEVAIIGTGFIAIEFANIAAAAGAKVQVIAHQHHILREFDQDLTQTMIAQMERKGIRFNWDFETRAVEKNATGVTLVATDGRRIQTEMAFVATGRIGNVDQINLSVTGVELGDNGVKVDTNLATNIKHIYAVGDVADTNVPKLTSTGAYEARYVANHILGTELAAIQYPAVPVIVFGSPKLGQVGVTPLQAQQLGYQIERFDMTNWLEYWRLKEPVAQAKVIFDADGVIVGATILSGSADEMLNYFTVAINQRQTKADLKQNMYAYPSLGSDLGFYFSGSNLPQNRQK